MKTYINTWFYSYLYKIICTHTKIYIYPNMLLYTHKYTYTYIFKVVYFLHGIIFLTNQLIYLHVNFLIILHFIKSFYVLILFV